MSDIPINKNKTDRFLVTLTPQTRFILEALAVKGKRSQAQIVREIIEWAGGRCGVVVPPEIAEEKTNATLAV